MNGHICPECGTERGSASEDGRPGCRCAERTAEAVRTERSAEVAEAEGFHPLRIRPYVTLQGPAGPETPDGAVTMPLAVVSGAVPGAGPGDDATAVMAAVAPTGAPPEFTPEATPEITPNAGWGQGYGEEPPVHDRKRRKGAGLWLAVGAAAVAVVSTAAFAGGLFSGGDERDGALPDFVTGLPSASADTEASASASKSGTGSGSPTPSASTSASASVSTSASASASASPSRSAGASPDAGADASGPVTPTSAVTPSTKQATGTVEQQPSEPAAAALSRGDRGPEVTELQHRLAQAGLYDGPKNGQFNDRVEQAVRRYQSYKSIQGDPEGTYGPNTRRALEAETQEP